VRTVTSDTTPQDRAVAALIERFRPGVFPYIGIKPEMDRAEKAIYDYRELTMGEIVDCLTDAGLLSSGTQEDQGGEGDGSLRSWPSAGGREERKSPRLRRSGSPWTLRVHTWDDDVQTPSHTVSNRAVPADSEHHRGHLFPQAEFDELVVGRWLHVEQMDNATWWMNVGGVTVHVNADREGRPRRVRVNGPLDYDEPREGCEYEIEWTEPK
jgi:hypothetical protein